MLAQCNQALQDNHLSFLSSNLQLKGLRPVIPAIFLLIAPQLSFSNKSVRVYCVCCWVQDITRVLTTILVATTACTIYSAAIFTNLATELLGPRGVRALHTTPV